MSLSKLRFFAKVRVTQKKNNKMTTYVLCKTLVLWLCSRSQPGMKVIIRGLRGHLLHTVTFVVVVFFT